MLQARALSETSAHLIQRERLAALGELAAAIAHEVRNPLAALKTSLQVLARRLGAEEARDFGADVQREVDRLNTLVASILDYARPAPAKPVPVIMPVILERAFALVGKSLDQHGIAFALDVEKPLPRALADPQQMEQVFLNLFLNARNAMPRGGRLTIKCRVGNAEGEVRNAECGVGNEPGGVEVVVADTGKGIAAEVLPRIFDPFFTTDPQGTGLGLAIAQRLVRENGGSILVESPPEGEEETVQSFGVLIEPKRCYSADEHPVKAKRWGPRPSGEAPRAWVRPLRDGARPRARAGPRA